MMRPGWVPLEGDENDLDAFPDRERATRILTSLDAWHPEKTRRHLEYGRLVSQWWREHPDSWDPNDDPEFRAAAAQLEAEWAARYTPDATS